MPTPYIEKLSKEGKGSIADLEKKWDKAKGLAADQGHAEEYDYITGIFNRMVGASIIGADMKPELQAASRLLQADQKPGLVKADKKPELLTADEVTAANNYLEKLARDGKHGSKAELEKKWDEAKGIANSEGIQAYPYMVAVFQNLIGVKKTASTLKLEAAARLKASAK